VDGKASSQSVPTTPEEWRQKAIDVSHELYLARTAEGMYRAGDPYSPVPSREYVAQRTAVARRVHPTLPGIELNVAGQLALLEAFRSYGAAFAFPDAPDGEHRYYCDNPWFATADAITLFCMMHHFRPKKIVEVGSGFSSALMLDVDAQHLGKSLELVCIDPEPGRLVSFLRKDDKHVTVVSVQVEEMINDAIFRSLRPNDILFIDSSHVIKYGNDLAKLFWDVLPVLEPGVLVHFHDIFYPFEYPDEWLQKGIFWSECYLLRALLTDNPTYRIELFSDYIERFHPDALRSVTPRWVGGGSLWLRKLATPAAAPPAGAPPPS